MRIAFIILVIAHGLIHLLGFKSFGLSEVKQLTQPIAKPFETVWLLTFILFVLAAIQFAFKHSYWWVFGLLAVVISQILIIFFWQDARFGTIANVIILMAVIIGYSTSAYYRKYQDDVKTGLQLASYFQPSDLTETDIQELPEPVKKYLRFTGSVGKPKVNNFKIEFTGKIRKDEQSEWMPFTSEQYNFMHTPTRLFFMKAIMKGMPVAGYHCFKNGYAFMDIRLLSLFKVQYQDGVEMDLSETVTFFNDMCCLAPPTLIDKRIKWLAVENNKVKASFTNNHITVFAWLYFNDKGELINFISDDRYSADAGKQLPWATPLKDYQEINGYRLMGNAETIYSYPDRDLVYGTFKLIRIEYNCID
ncbi:hypothetical protein GXP67_00820 [Rhodocytophaga rosea]|uniref:Uncharacterized protein n=1 Tax=Rhodocytophaga rosea TaxID=2704465 RepID=A0A6C0GBP9_9BACT|nr:DUF6544 family protein [Rhodocytophaga rosea]QHT65317.1 hypothetical protein GXP67_00820 [Rhodocytophaga rosea]